MNAPSSTRTIYEQLERIEPARVAVQRGNESLTYGELRQRVDAFAAFLAGLGIAPGDRIATRLQKGFEEIICTYAAARLGAVIVNIHPAWPGTQANLVLASAQPKVLVGGAKDLDGLTTNALIVSINPSETDDDALSFSAALATPDKPPPHFTDTTALATLLFTSGSTGQPKGVMHSHRNLVQFGSHVAEYLGNTPDDRILGLLPISFSYGLNQLLSAIHVGATLVMPESTMPTEIVATLEHQRITGMAGVAIILDQIADVLEDGESELPHLRYVTCAGGALPNSIGNRLRHLLPDCALVLMYGSTETLRSTYLPAKLYDSKPGAIGHAIPGVSVEIITEDGRRAKPNETGELVHCGDLKMLGYWQDESATAAKLRPCRALHDNIGDEAVLYTGDLAYRDADDCLWFAGRADWMIKSSGFRYSITELEDAITALPSIASAVALPHDDPRSGQAADVAVVLQDPDSLSEKSVLRTVKRELPGYMWPRAVHIIKGELPVTANGKLDRPALIDSLSADTPTVPASRHS